jgi:DNA helicase-2/ATP-dependent DNA helicase PcrA
VFEFLDRAALSSELDQFDPDARVSLLTVHSAKGLEFDVVFLAGLEDGLFPHHQSSDSREELEEERRLCYVGMTRARRKLYLTWTPFRRSYGPDLGAPAFPSRFLAEVPPELVEGLHLDADFVGEDGEEEYAGASAAGIRGGREEFDGGPGKAPTTLAELRAYLEKKKTADSGKPAGPALHTGMRVRHPQFGDGIILKRERSGKDVKLTITFAGSGRKTLVERYARLKVL